MKAAFDPAQAGPIPTEQARIAHVTKHLLAPSEGWHLVTEGLPPDPIAAGQAAGCGPMLLAPERASYFDLPPEGRGWLLDLHDRHLQPAYLAAVASASASGRWGWWQADDRLQAALVGDNGVFVIVRAWGKPDRPCVRTAYRVVPRGTRGAPTRDDFLRAAVRKLSDKSSYEGKKP
jgi:hypothetical protein